MRTPILCGVGLALAAGVAGPPAEAQEGVDLRAGAWDRSIALERRGDLEAARDLMMRAWGSDTESYEVMVRVAWLNLRLERWDEAIASYRRARELDGADQEATDGLVTSLCGRGSWRLEARDFAEARAAWEQALKLAPSDGRAKRGLALIGPASRLDPETWFGVVQQRPTGSGWTGWAAFFHLPWQVNDAISVRAAYRHTRTESRERTPRGRQVVTTWQQNEVYGGVGARFAYTAVDVLGMGVMAPSEAAAPGGQLRLRLGGRYGLDHQQIAISREAGWNHQTWPSLYGWLGDRWQLKVGARATSDEVGRGWSGTAAMQAGAGPIWMRLDGHVGTERWAFDAEGLSLMAIPGETTMGGRGTVMMNLSETWRLGLQGHAESTRNGGQNGMNWSASAGLQWSPMLKQRTGR